jgi:hypothetical protein
MFGQLPSYVLANGSVFDIMVANTLAEYENNILNGNNQKPTPQLSQEEMMNMIKAVRG